MGEYHFPCRIAWSAILTHPVCVVRRVLHLGLLPSPRVQVSSRPTVILCTWDCADAFRRGRTFRELDILFEQQVPARKFRTTQVALETDQKEEYHPPSAAH